mmetsp:Transcript_27665/g.40826  ORF Transcript_27665/g.40826 Transcript_27665/m.40826 type:complete len:264 (+) Transcript_27665:321-1112(+)
MVMADLPLIIFPYIDESVTSLNLGTSCTHGEFVDSAILSDIHTNLNIALKDSSLWLKLQEVNKVIFDRLEVGTGSIAYSGEKDTLFGISHGNLLWVLGGQSIIPKSEQILNLRFGDGLTHGNLLGHDTRVMVLDLPYSILLNVKESVTSLYLISGCTHGEFVNTGITGPSISNADISIKDLSLRLFEKESIEVILNRVKVSSGSVADGRQQNRGSSVTTGNNTRISSGQGGIPEAEKGTDFFFVNHFFGYLGVVVELALLVSL